ncbi:MAG: helix-hairpin-helix domain-containing protein [Oscillospiraceae bacterium]|nr:helix-hairpin-helix domain-containing protein [Oscillospiraceae bacterium]
MDKRDLHEIYLIAAALICCAVIIAYNALSAMPLSQPAWISNAPPSKTTSSSSETSSDTLKQSIESLEGALFEADEAISTEPISQPEEDAIIAESSSTSTTTAAASTSKAATTAKPKAPSKVNINTASAALLAEVLPGIGEIKAKAIVDYRETYGLFTSVDELINVNGIGEKTLEKIRPYCTL